MGTVGARVARDAGAVRLVVAPRERERVRRAGEARARRRRANRCRVGAAFARGALARAGVDLPLVRLSGFGFRVSGLRFRVSDLRFWAQGC